MKMKIQSAPMCDMVMQYFLSRNGSNGSVINLSGIAYALAEIHYKTAIA
jgi:hypothetical protein